MAMTILSFSDSSKEPGEEWGEFSLSELRACAEFRLLIERDIDFKPDRLSQIISCGR